MTEKADNNLFMQQKDNELRILELFERRNELTDDELKELAASADMQDALLDLMDMEEAVKTNNDIPTSDRNKKSLSLKLLYIAAACAVALVTFVFWNKAATPSTTNNGDIVVAETLPKNTVFQKQDNSRGVTLTSVTGTDVTPALQSTGKSVVADFTVLKKAEAQEVKMDVPVGYDATVTLPDGTIAYLHPGSRLKFPTKFTGEYRQVILQGECYFKVAHDAAHPFIVEADNVVTTVLGTEFNVTTEGEHGTVVTLINGSVQVKGTNSDANMVIVPGQQVILKNNRFVTKNVDTSIYEAWRDGFICYDNMPMSEVMEAIGRNYNMTVHFSNRKAMQIPVRFLCERSATVEDAIALINSLKRVTVKIQNDIIVVE